VAVALVVGQAGAAGIAALGERVALGLTRMGAAGRDLGPEKVAALAIDSAMSLAVVAGPLALAVAAAAVLAQGAQGGWVFSPAALEPDWNRLSPANGLSRLTFSRGGVELLRACLFGAAIVAVAASLIASVVPAASQLAWLEPVEAGRQGWAWAGRLLWQVALATLTLALLDVGVERWRMMTSLKMTKQEVRDDTRMTEGSPDVKARIRRAQREMSRRRMLPAVKRATVVVTNPTEYAVALEYRRDAMPAPRVVAKGKGWLAARIRTEARRHGVPTVENVALARALYGGVEVGETIPAALFDAVAEVLAYLIRLKQVVI
jgi:flagellar biosynthetic protein FlhB